jgi:hypothetical protein
MREVRHLLAAGKRLIQAQPTSRLSYPRTPLKTGTGKGSSFETDSLFPRPHPQGRPTPKAASVRSRKRRARTRVQRMRCPPDRDGKRAPSERAQHLPQGTLTVRQRTNSLDCIEDEE